MQEAKTHTKQESKRLSAALCKTANGEPASPLPKCAVGRGLSVLYGYIQTGCCLSLVSGFHSYPDNHGSSPEIAFFMLSSNEKDKSCNTCSKCLTKPVRRFVVGQLAGPASGMAR